MNFLRKFIPFLSTRHVFHFVQITFFFSAYQVLVYGFAIPLLHQTTLKQAYVHFLENYPCKVFRGKKSFSVLTTFLRHEKCQNFISSAKAKPIYLLFAIGILLGENPTTKFYVKRSFCAKRTVRLTPVIRDPFPFSTLLFAKLVKFGVFSDFLNFL